MQTFSFPGLVLVNLPSKKWIKWIAKYLDANINICKNKDTHMHISFNETLKAYELELPYYFILTSKQTAVEIQSTIMRMELD